ncbi:MAG: putative ABC transporter permease [Mollicutes bacterium]|nr:putative ABC transporter permease [Mollicutes bacterium]
MFDLKVLFLLFIVYSITGWIIEVIATYPDTKCFVNRGFLIGPYCPIYGNCAIAMIFLLHNVTNPILLFVLSILICSVGEYVTSYTMEKIFHARWWDYSKNKFNLNGRICLVNSLAFGVLGFLLIKFVNPFVVGLITKLSPTMINVLFYTILTLFIIDNVISFKVIFKIKNMSIKYVHLDNTKEITEKVKKILSDNILAKRVFKAFPNIKFRFNLKEKMKVLKDKAISIKNNYKK